MSGISGNFKGQEEWWPSKANLQAHIAAWESCVEEQEKRLKVSKEYLAFMKESLSNHEKADETV